MTQNIFMEEYSRITPQIEDLTERWSKNCHIDRALYQKYDVKRGLRDANGRGVLASLTRISEVKGYTVDGNDTIPCEGVLYYRGYDVRELVNGSLSDKRFGFEETAFLLLMGRLPNREELGKFTELLGEMRPLPPMFTEDMILKAPSSNVMNKIARSVLALYSYDDKAEVMTLENELRQAISLIARTPMIVAHAYAAKRCYFDGDSLYLHRAQDGMSLAENFLYAVRKDNKFTDSEAKLLDLCLVLHAEHGGGNNSAFTCRVISSSHTDFYSSIAAAVGSLKGPRHGGANIRAKQMLDVVAENVGDWKDDEEVQSVLSRIIHKELGDGSGLIYGMGHAVYTMSDPRAQILKTHAKSLAYKKGYDEEYELLCSIERLAPQVFAEEKHGPKKVCANVDLFSGLIYRMLGISEDLYTPLFAIARVPGWCAHRVEEVEFANRIIRPAYKYLGKPQEYVPLEKR